MRSRGVLVLRLGVWGLGVDAKSVRSVRKRSPCVRKRLRPKIVPRGEQRKREERGEERGQKKEERGDEREENREERREERGERMILDLSILMGFASGLLLSLRCTCQCLRSGSCILSGFPCHVSQWLGDPAQRLSCHLRGL